MQQKYAKKQMRIVALLLLILLISVQSATAYCFAKGALQLSARAAVLMDVATGQVLFSRNGDLRLPMASTTKIMTGILAIEMGDLKEQVRVSPRAASQEGSSIWLTAGEVLTLEELLYGLLLSSGNDAAVAIAEHLAGSMEEFTKLMNLKARQLGATKTHFANPHGLPHPEHVTTARELAAIARYALHNPLFNKIVATKHKTISWPGKKWARGLRNHNKLLWLYPYADGVKTGFTRAAGRCLVSSATRDGRRLVAVVLNSPQHYADSRMLLEYGFNQFEKFTVIQQGEVVREIKVESRKEPVRLAAGVSFSWTIPAGEMVEVQKKIVVSNKNLGQRAGQRAGLMKIYIKGKEVGVIPLIIK